jgi:pimeloyl-ACP methyl ester carboxylesterase
LTAAEAPAGRRSRRLPGRGAAAALRLLAGLGVSVVLGACATPAERADDIAAASGFERRVVAGDPFAHLIFVKPGRSAKGDFHVYLEGDGTPWISRGRVAADPTPRQPLMLELMRLDPGPALYLGRPCYFGLMRGCRPEHWTGGRYSEVVVDSMVAALRNARRELGWTGDISLLGHSGGGTLAMLMAPLLSETQAVVTVAANLDVGEWTRLHGYTPLSGSLDPAIVGPLPARIRQLHVVGEKDRVVPPAIARPVVDRQDNVQLLSFPSHDHHCCWEKEWRSILDRL